LVFLPLPQAPPFRLHCQDEVERPGLGSNGSTSANKSACVHIDTDVKLLERARALDPAVMTRRVRRSPTADRSSQRSWCWKIVRSGVTPATTTVGLLAWG